MCFGWLAEGILPARVTSDKEKTKIGFFHSAVDSWFRAQISGAVSEYLLSDDLACAEFLDQAELQAAVRRHLAGTDTENTYGLFAILMLEVWLSSYLPLCSRRECASRPLTTKEEQLAATGD